MDDTFVIHKEANKKGFLQHINSVDPAIKFTVEDNKEDGSIPFLDTIVKPGKMVVYPLLCTGSQLIQTSTYSGIATITSLPSLVSLTPSPIGPKLCAAILSCLSKKKEYLRKALTKCKYPSGLWTKWRKGSTGLPFRLLMGLTTRVLIVPLLPPEKLRVWVIWSYPTHKVFVKVSKRSVVGMVSKLTSKVAVPSKTSWSPLRTKTLWSPKVMPSIGISVGTSHVMMNT